MSTALNERGVTMQGYSDLRFALERAEELRVEAIRERLARLAHPHAGARRLIAEAFYAIARAAASVGRSVDVASAT